MKRMAGVVTGNYAGVFTRLAAFVIDWLVIAVSYSLLLGGASFLLSALFAWDIGVADSDHSLYWILGMAGWAFIYLVVGLIVSGRTPGKAVVGLRVVCRDGTPLTPARAAVRVLALPLSFAILGLGFLGVLFGRERRALHDVIAGAAVVYDWGDRPAELPAPLTNWLERTQAIKPTAGGWTPGT